GALLLGGKFEIGEGHLLSHGSVLSQAGVEVVYGKVGDLFRPSLADQSCAAYPRAAKYLYHFVSGECGQSLACYAVEWWSQCEPYNTKAVPVRLLNSAPVSSLSAPRFISF
ncbi:hypothetical protein, partial [Chromobacterium violaceum]|uniref:hypothetical protein n=1 Tax=Chromobacterium violaceum TaxID=536 RepID=UPI001C392CD4